MLSFKYNLKIHINKQILACIALCFYLIQDLIYAICSIPFGGGVLARNITIFLIYFPLMLMLVLEGEKRKVWDAYLLILLVLAFFLITYWVHPEYHYWFFEGVYSLDVVIFRPDKCIFAYLFFRMIKTPNDILKTLKVTGYILFLYYTYQLIHALSVGYWLYNSTGTVEKWSYNLNYGYDQLLVTAIFGYFGMKEKKLIYWGICGTSVIEILLGGSRGPLLGVGILGLVLLVRYFKELSKQVRIFLVLGIIFAGILFLGIGFNTILEVIATAMKNMGISSRTLEMFLQGEIASDNNRNRIYETAIQMIRESGLFGYGAYGDRYVIGRLAYVGYCHNLFLEILIDFGIIIGSIFIVKMVLISTELLFFSKNRLWGDIYMILFISITKLFLSGSFWYSEAFWAALAVWISYRQYCKHEHKRMINVKGNA